MLRFVLKRLFLAIFLVHVYRISLAKTEDIKTWSTNTNFLNHRNWKDGQIPCANDRVIFSDTYPAITLMPESFAVGEMILPLNGEIIFPENAMIEITGGTREGECKGKDVHFLPTMDYWYDPLSWNITSDRAFPRIPNRKNLAVPHAFQIPCQTDKVVFPEQTAFQSLVLYPVTKIGFLYINGVSYTQNEFSNLLDTHIGPLLFPNRPNIRITGSHCNDATGCVCGNDDPSVMPTVCAPVTPDCNPSLDCMDPVTPVGNCCPICGVQMKIKYNEKFKISKLMTLHESFLNKDEYSGVESFTGKTYAGDIQAVFVDGDKYKGRANKVAQLIHDTLTSDISSGNSYGIQSIEMVKSERWNSGVPTYDQYVSGGMSPGGTAALVIFLIVGIGLAIAFFIYKKRHIPGFNFARFDLRGDRIELELGTTPHDELQPTDPPLASSAEEEQSKGFDNPVYGTAVEEVMPSVAESSNEVKDFVENPMFTIFEDSPKQNEDSESKWTPQD